MEEISHTWELWQNHQKMKQSEDVVILILKKQPVMVFVVVVVVVARCEKAGAGHFFTPLCSTLR